MEANEALIVNLDQIIAELKKENTALKTNNEILVRQVTHPGLVDESKDQRPTMADVFELNPVFWERPIPALPKLPPGRHDIVYKKD